MKISRTKLSRTAFAALLLAGAALPVLAQDRPESLLPPGFDQPVAPAPAPAPAATRAAETAPRPSQPSAPERTETAASGDATAPVESAPAAPIDVTRYELPDYARHSLDRVGMAAFGNASFPVRSFGSADGRFLTTLMRRIDAPVASRWVSIALRRGLQSKVNTPRNIDGADFAAERAWLLLRMGEPIAARGVVQDVDVENYTPTMLQMAMEVALANADPGAICAFADRGAGTLQARGWPFARAMCAGLAGQPDRAGELLKAAGGGGGDIDTLLAEKVVGIGAQGRRAVTIEWNGVTELTSWRWGLATATGEEVPDALYGTAGPQVRFWRALSPRLAPSDRVRAAEAAAMQGVFSCDGLVDLYGEVEEQGDASTTLVAAARDLRSSFSAATIEERVTALKTLWDEPDVATYARMILTARAAAAIPASPDRAADADRLVASMLTAGLETHAEAWRGVVARGSDGWAMLALAGDQASSVSSGDFDAFRNKASERKAQLLLAGLAGLGRLSESDSRRYASALDVSIGAGNSWTRAIENAARRGDPGTVALLAATAMQTRSWSRVTPEALFHIVAAFRATGMEPYARMIAIEAIARA